MMGKSDLGWDDNRCMVTVDSQDVSDEYCKVEPTARTMCYKSWPFFPAWREILGKDRAEGERTLDVNETVHVAKSYCGTTDTQDCYVPSAEWCPEFGYVGNDTGALDEFR
ncbi:UNVERIFIED_CONTAM: hypothetical protein Sindi_1858800 [Sesamum indicum]